MNRRRALIGLTLTMGLLLGLGLIDLLDFPSWRVQAEHGSPGNQAAGQAAAPGTAAYQQLKASAAGLAPAGYAVQAAAPEMSVEQTLGTVIADGGSKDFGTVAVRTNKTLTFTIKNTGNAPLNLTGNPRVVIGGAHAADFTVTTQPASPVPVSNVSIPNGGFETPTIGGTGYAYAPSGASWTFSNPDGISSSGIARNGSGWYSINAPQGTQAALISREGFFSQAINFPALGDYVIRFSMIKASNRSANSIVVKMDGTTLGTILNSSQVEFEWRTFAVPYTCTAAGNHTLTFAGTGSGAGSIASVIDDVQVTAQAGIFQVAFAPSAGGPRSATLSIANNDSDENPYNITLTGTGLTRPEISLEQPAGTPLATGQVVAWGFNGYGQTNVPGGLEGVKAIASGGQHMAALKGDGIVVTWGNTSAAPEGLTNVVAIDAGRGHTVALKSDGTVVAWGLNNAGQLNVPPGLTGVVAIAAGESGTSALKSDGTIVKWGFTTAAPPAGLTNLVDIAMGLSHILALKGDGTVLAWGQGFNGETSVPPGLTGVTAIAARQYGSFAVKSDGTVVAWGSNGSPPAGLTGVVNVAMGLGHFLALKNDGTVFAWGQNNYGQVNVPAGLKGVRAISANSSEDSYYYGHSAALTDSAVDFGNQPLGTTSAAKTFTIKNTGTAPLSISNVSVIGGQASNFTVNTVGMLTTVPINGQTTFRVSFTPSSVGAKHTTLRVLNSDSDEGSFYVHLSGVGVPPSPEIAVFTGASTAPADERTSNIGTHTFANTTVGSSSATQTFTIKNTGTANLTGLAVTKAGANPGDFVLGALGAATLAPNATTTFTVRFAPMASGVRNAVVNIASNDADENPFVIRVSGTGVNSPPTITPSNLTRQQGNPSTNVQVATVMDAQDAEQNLVVTVNGGASATVNGVTINTLTVNLAGQVRANLAANCTATNASFALAVTDSAGATANATLTVTVTANAAPTVGAYPNTLVAPGGNTTVTPAAAPADNGSIASVTAAASPAGFTGSLTANTATGAVTITGANPMNSFLITVTVTDNCGQTATRTFTLTVNDCGATLSKMGQNFAANGGTGNFTVTINSACTWTAVSNHPSFITVTAPAGTLAGNGTVSFSVASHSNATSRTGTITVAGQTFTVRQGAQFLDVPLGAPLYEEIGKLSAAGITTGCGGGNYCPDTDVSREQIAAFLSRALGVFNPPPPGAQRFADVPESNAFYAFIEEMAVRQITLGCGGGNYCPADDVTRDQMAGFIIRALHEPGYVPPTNVPQRFADVPSSNPFYGHIEEMAVRGITLGCGGGNYCPTNNVTRAQMAAFLVRAFGL